MMSVILNAPVTDTRTRRTFVLSNSPEHGGSVRYIREFLRLLVFGCVWAGVIFAISFQSVHDGLSAGAIFGPVLAVFGTGVIAWRTRHSVGTLSPWQNMTVPILAPIDEATMRVAAALRYNLPMRSVAIEPPRVHARSSRGPWTWGGNHVIVDLVAADPHLTLAAIHT
jgi:hypothetical protein